MFQDIFQRRAICVRRLSLGLALIAASIWSMAGFNVAAEPALAPASEPLMVRNGEKIFVPAGSALRARLLVVAATEQMSSHLLSLPATVEANPANTYNVLPPLTGKLVELKVRLGDTVRAGQILATLSSPDLAQAWSDDRKARDALNLAQRALERARGVNEAGSNAVKDVEAAQSNVIQQQAEAERTEARLKTLGPTSGNHLLNIVAPASGTVTALNVAPGSYLNDATAALLTVSNLDQVWVSVSVPENRIAEVKKGQSVTVMLPAYPDWNLTATVSFVSAILEPDTHRLKARIALANPDGRLKPNMYATVVLSVPQSRQVEVPTSALLMNNDSLSVFVEVKPWTFVRRVVEEGQEDEGGVRIRSGLKAGERVVVRGGVLLND